jgi:amino acid transporter
MTGGRALYAVARAGRAPSCLANLNRNGTPWVALFAQMVWTVVLLCIPGSSFSTLLDYFGPASWFFYALTGFSVILLRFKEPSLKRPFVTPLYPLPPIILCILSCCLIFTSIVWSPFFTLLAFSFIASTIPVYYLSFETNDSISNISNCYRYICSFVTKCYELVVLRRINFLLNNRTYTVLNTAGDNERSGLDSYGI